MSKKEWQFYRKKPKVIRAKMLTSEMTLAEGVVAEAGDYIIEDGGGTFYSMTELEFKRTFTKVTDYEPSRIEILEAALKGAIEECKTLLTLYLALKRKDKDGVTELHSKIIERFEAVALGEEEGLQGRKEDNCE